MPRCKWLDTLIETFDVASYFRPQIRRFERNRLKMGVFERKNDRLVWCRWLWMSDTVQLSDIIHWTDFPEMVTIVKITLANGRCLMWEDNPEGELVGILEEAVPNKRTRGAPKVLGVNSPRLTE